jgi:hypothetical protein
MTKKTSTTLGISVTIFVSMTAILIYAYSAVSAKGTEVTTLKQTLAEQRVKQDAARSVAIVMESTTDARAELADYFVTEKDTISFIAEIEDTARRMGVKLETTNLAIIPKKDAEAAKLKTSFSIEGSQLAVESFVRALESLPYHSVVPRVQFNANEGGLWAATVDVLVTITP